MREALAEGKSIYSGGIDYEDCKYSYARIFEEIWRIMKENGDGSFVEIDGDLSY